MSREARQRRISPQITESEIPDRLAREAGFRRIAGVDEAGRGPWAGPVVASAVVLHRSRVGVRIDDGKRLTPRQREVAFRAILECADVGLGIASADWIDRHNILRATLLAMSEAVEDLAAPPELVLVDGTHRPAVEAPCWPIIGGDRRSYCISCASIVAKVVRDRLMGFYHQLYPAFGFDQHKGYGTQVHARALAMLGPTAIHRLSFNPVARVRAVDGEQRLLEFKSRVCRGH